MTLSVYCVEDRTAQMISEPFVAKNDGIASRIFKQQAVKSEYPDDFRLLCLGEFENEEPYRLVGLPVPRAVALKESAN